MYNERIGENRNYNELDGDGNRRNAKNVGSLFGCMVGIIGNVISLLIGW